MGSCLVTFRHTNTILFGARCLPHSSSKSVREKKNQKMIFTAWPILCIQMSSHSLHWLLAPRRNKQTNTRAWIWIFNQNYFYYYLLIIVLGMLSGEKYTNARIRTKNTFRTFFTIYIYVELRAREQLQFVIFSLRILETSKNWAIFDKLIKCDNQIYKSIKWIVLWLISLPQDSKPPICSQIHAHAYTHREQQRGTWMGM